MTLWWNDVDENQGQEDDNENDCDDDDERDEKDDVLMMRRIEEDNYYDYHSDSADVDDHDFVHDDDEHIQYGDDIF